MNRAAIDIEQAQPQTLRIAVAGAGGRMGRMLIDATLHSTDCVLVAALEQADSPLIGQDAAGGSAPCGVAVQSDVHAALAQGRADCLIDFTRPAGTLAHLAVCAELGVNMVIGTTGFSPAQLAEISARARRTALVLAPNMGVGINVLLKLLELAAQALPDSDWDVEIIEAHHRHKVDAPSGTALQMGQVIADAQGSELAARAVYARHGHTGERAPGSIGFATVRGGDLVGEHSALFIGSGERITISHQSTARSGYAQGSLRAARFLAGKTSGQYSMRDVLGLG